MRQFLILAISLLTLAAQAQTDYVIEEIAAGLDEPWSVAFLPNGGYLVSMRGGELHRISDTGEISPPLSGVPETLYHGQGGFFDIVLDPDFNTNQTVYLAFAHGHRKANATRVIRATLGDAGLTDSEAIFTTNAPKDTGAHYGGRIAFLADGSMLVTTGDGFQYRDAAQDPSNEMGKVVRINRDGSVPTDNPFIGDDQNDDRVYSYGHRNPQGLAVANDGTIYLHEHGPKGGDEVNVIKAGENYGWPAATYGVNYSGARVSPHETLPGMVDGIKVWVPSIAPSGLAVYERDQFAEWQGNLLVGALAAGGVRRLELQDGKVTAEHNAFPEITARVRDVRVSEDGSIYVLTDGKSGKLYRVSKS